MVINMIPEEVMWFVNKEIFNLNLHKHIKPRLFIDENGEYRLDLSMLIRNNKLISKDVDENLLCNIIKSSLEEIEKLVFDILKDSAQHSELDFYPNENNLQLKVMQSNILPQGQVLMNYKDTFELDRLANEKYGSVIVLGRVKSFKNKNK